MKKTVMLFALLLASLTLAAQEAIFQKYSQHGDVATVNVSKAMLDRVPKEQLDIPGLGAMLDRIDRLTILTARAATNVAKQMRTKLPKQLQGEGFQVQLATKQDGVPVTLLRSKKDPRRVVLVAETKVNTVVALLEGDFSDEDFAAE